MSNQKEIEKMRENILSGSKNFVGVKQDYCDCQEHCKLLIMTNSQYEAVVKQNQSLQNEVIWRKKQSDKDNDYIIKLEEANMLLEQDVETLKKQLEALQEELAKYQKAVMKIDTLTNSEVKNAR